MTTMSRTVAGHRQHDFDRALRAAIADRGLALSRIRHRLQERGLAVGVSTLSYWQNGERVPRSPESVRVVEALEDILGLPSESLTDLLPEEGCAARAVRWQPSAKLATLVDYSDSVDLLLDDMKSDPVGQTETISLIEGVTVSRSGAIDSVNVIHVLRAVRALERVVLTWQGEEGSDASLIEVESIAGCRVGRVRRDQGRALLVAELIFDRTIHHPQTRMLQYVIRDGNDIPAHDYYHLLARPNGVQVMEVVFHPEHVPVRVTEFFRKRLDGPDVRSSPMILHDGHRVHLPLERVGPGVAGISWEFP